MVAVHSARPSPAVRQPVSSTLMVGEPGIDAESRPCGPASAAEARWQIASTIPPDISRPNRSRESSAMSRRETRLRAESVTAAA